MIARLLSGSLALASAQFNPFDGMAGTRANTPFGATPAADAGPQCEPEQNFFQKGIGQALIQHPEFDGSNVKIALGRNTKYFQVDQPFSHAANALSLAEVPIGALEEEDPVEKEANDLRAKIRAKHAWSGARIEEADKIRKLELKAEEEALKGKDSSKATVDVFYVNMDNQKERKNCLERQFKDMPGKPQPKRYPALRFPDVCSKSKTHQKYEECLKEADLGDCFESGIDYAATGTHGTQNHDEHRIRSAVLSNWCGHKRLFKQLEADAKNGTAADYVVILEDDVILDRKYFMNVIKDFATQYHNRDWDLVQLDPFGHKDRKDFVEHFRGKPVFKPAADSTCSAYWGFHAVLLKTSALHRINHWMSMNQAVPIDWLPWRMPHVLAYSALVSRNPEAALKGGVVVLPQYCSSKVMKSTIG